MKKNLLLVLASIFSLLIYSCQNDNSVIPEPQKNNTESNKINEKEAREEAIKLYEVLFSNKLRATSKPKIKAVDKLGSTTRSTKISSEKEVGIYVVNFEDDKGFMLLSDDKRAEPLIAFSNEGNFENYQDNPNIYPIISNSLSLINSINRNCPYRSEMGDSRHLFRPGRTVWCDVCKEEHTLKASFVDKIYGEWYVDKEIKPLIPVEWGQDNPYNLQLDSIKGILPPVGCVATAVAQIMCYYKKPNNIDWDKVIQLLYHKKNYNKLDIRDQNYIINNISKLFKDIGRAENLNMHYGKDSSGALSKNVTRTFQNYGYSCGELIKYNWDKVRNEIENNRPVYVRANSHAEKEDDLIIDYKYGHAWVLDGIQVHKRAVNIITDSNNWVEYETKYFVHCNLGWDGKCNAYYLSDIIKADFNTNNIPKQPNLRTITIGEYRNYQFNQKIIIGIRP